MTVSDWMRRNYKTNRFHNEPGFHSDREQRLIADREEDMKNDGFAIISWHDSNSGRLEVLGTCPPWLREPETANFTAA